MLKRHIQLSEHFNSKEFDSPDLPFSGTLINMRLVQKLQCMRYLYLKPIVVNSGVRSSGHNEHVGGKKDSEHLFLNAVDIECITDKDRYTLIKLAFNVGFTRIGIYKNHLHLDVSTIKNQFRVWI